MSMKLKRFPSETHQQSRIGNLINNIDTRSSDYHNELTTSGHEFMTSDLQEDDFFRYDVGFGVGLTDETISLCQISRGLRICP